MNAAGNIFKNNTLAALERQATPGVVHAIQKASASTGVDFAYLMEKAAAESSFRTDIKAKTSSATGLFQFIEKTWIAMVRDHGHDHGLKKYADKISADGKVTDARTRREILELRKDPETAAAMAAEYAADNKAYLESRVKGDIGPVELYLAHFMGPGGAAGFLSAMKKNPLDTAADIFPTAARANRGVFYDSKTGQPRTLAGVYDFFAQKFRNSTQDSGGDTTVMAATAPADEPRMAGAIMAGPAQAAPYAALMKSDSYDTDLLWAQEIFRDNQAQQLRVLAGDDNAQRTMRGNERFAHLNTRNGQGLQNGLKTAVSNPVQVMQLAQADLHSLRGRYN